MIRNRIWVEPMDRRDEKTILCRVCWNSADGRTLRVIVPVAATLDEFSAPVQHGPDFAILDVAPHLPEEIRCRAVDAAQSLASEFVAIDIVNLVSPRPR